MASYFDNIVEMVICSIILNVFVEYFVIVKLTFSWHTDANMTKNNIIFEISDLENLWEQS